MTQQDMAAAAQTLLARGNAAFRGRDYEEAIYCYERALWDAPEALRSSLAFNRGFAERRLRDQHGAAAQAVLDRIQHRLKLEQEIDTVRPFFDADYYLASNPDVAAAGVDPTEHYCGTGWREGRDPHPAFCTRYYLKTYPDVEATGINPFWHYLVAGKAEGRHGRANDADGALATLQPIAIPIEKPENLEDYFFDQIRSSGLFDPTWYLQQYGTRHGVSGNPLAHYLEHGVRLSTNPSPGFDTAYYYRTNPDVAGSGLHPFLHYVCQGHKEGRSAKPPAQTDSLDRYVTEDPVYVPRLAPDTPPPDQPVRVIAFYLPQFHTIPENDTWWGEGFTEWTNVRPAIPQFPGHYQPHEPDDFLGYYDLRDTSVMRKQIDLARQYGIQGFCFYVYWFSGKRLLETPVDNYLADPTLDHPFCVCWANENWSRRWDGLDHDLLMVQNYSDQDDLAFIAQMAKYLRDPRYIRVEGKPLLVVYRPNLFPSMKRTAQRWRDWCRHNGLGELHIAYVQSFETVPPEQYGLDAAIEFPPNNSAPPDVTRQMTEDNPGFAGRVYDWRVFIQRSEQYAPPAYPLYRGACPSWDNTARKKERAGIFVNSSPMLFQRWLVNAFRDTVERIDDPDKRLIFINAWNEWAEGTHLEPDRRHGYAWLQAVRNAHQMVLKQPSRVLLVSHDAHPHGAQILCLNFARHFKQQFRYEVDLIVLGEGRLIPKYRQYADVHQVNLAQTDESSLDTLLTSLRKKGSSVAIVNTTVSGPLVPHLKRHGFAVVSLVHEMPGILTAYGLQQHALQIADHADAVVFPARQVQAGFEACVGHPLTQATIRPQGIYLRSPLRQGADKAGVRTQIRRQLGLPDRARIIMCAGYADRRKGFDLFVRACIQVMQRLPDIHALWVGHLDQAFVDHSMSAATAAGLAERFLFTGLVDQPEPYFLAADVYALTSREDPFPSVVMEALDALTPVVAFKDCGGFENLLSRGCGALVPKEDTAAFAGALTDLLENRELAQTLAEHGRNIIETEFSFRHYLFDLLAYAKRSIPRISVVVPNYKYEKYIRQRLESATNQTYPIYELIILDDCSPDNSVAVIQDFLKFCDVPHRLLVNEHNTGSVFQQWLTGVTMARGDLVWIAEADDVAEPDFLKSLIPFFNDPDVVLAYTQSKQIDENDRLLAHDYLAYTNDVGDYWRHDYVVDGRTEIKRALCIKNTIPNVSAVLFKRAPLMNTLQSAGNAIKAMRVAGDWLLYLHLASIGKVAYHATALNRHRRHVNSVTKAHDHLQEVIAAQRQATQLVDLNEQSTRRAQEYATTLRAYFSQTTP